MPSRRQFVKKTVLGSAALCSPLAYGSAMPIDFLAPTPPKLSLAQWSLNRAFFSGELDPLDFARIARTEYDIKAVEYVSAFYADKGADTEFWQNMQRRADDEGVSSLLIMVDDEGELGDKNDTQRKTAVENHYKWIEAVKLLGGHSIRVNAFGKGGRKKLQAALVDGLGQLATYGASVGINVLVENHGLHTSDAEFMVAVIKEVNHPFLGTLPDFGNWCLSAEWGSTQGFCEKTFDPYKGVKLFMPFAKGVSAKAYAFDEMGEETRINYQQMLRIVKWAGYNGHIGIEFEGKHLSEPEGIRATKKLIEYVWKEI